MGVDHPLCRAWPSESYSTSVQVPPVQTHRVLPAVPVVFDRRLPGMQGLGGLELVEVSTTHVGMLGLVENREYPTALPPALTGSPTTYIATFASDSLVVCAVDSRLTSSSML